MRLCKVICRALPRPGEQWCRGSWERDLGDPGRPWSCGRMRPSRRDLLSLWGLEKKAALHYLSPGVPFRTQDFLPDPSRPDWGAARARNLGQISGVPFFLGKLQLYSLHLVLECFSKPLPAFGFLDGPIRS